MHPSVGSSFSGASSLALMMAKMKYPTVFGNKGRMGFLELYISHIINKKLQNAKGST